MSLIVLVLAFKCIVKKHIEFTEGSKGGGVTCLPWLHRTMKMHNRSSTESVALWHCASRTLASGKAKSSPDWVTFTVCG